MNKICFPAILSAFLYGVSIPISKIFLLKGVNPVILGALMYFGAGVGLLIFNSLKLFKKEKMFQNPLTKSEMPYTVFMVLLDISAIISLMYGLSKTNSANASLLSNFEIVATSIFAYLIFKEKISRKLWFAIILILFASIILTFEGFDAFNFTFGSIFVLLSFTFWGMENNCTKMISSKNTQEITIIKGLFSGTGSLAIAYFLNYTLPDFLMILYILLTGFLSYGISVSLYIYSQNKLGAAKTASYFSFAPYIGAILSVFVLLQPIKINFCIALLIMLFAGYLIYKDNN